MAVAIFVLLLSFYNIGQQVFDIVGNGHEVYGIYQDVVDKDLQPEIKAILLDIKKELDYTIKDIWKTALTDDYKKQIEINTDVLFNSLEKFLDNPSSIFFEDVKEICAKNQPFTLLTTLKLMLEDRDSTYIKHVHALGWKSKSADDVMKGIQNTLKKLLVSYGFCRGFNKEIRGTPIHVMEIVNKTMDLLKKQRKQIPNLLRSDIVKNYLESIKYSFPKCDDEEDEKNCTEKVANFVSNNLQCSFDYGKKWTVRVSRGSRCEIKSNDNSFETEVSGFNILVYFTNPVSSMSEIPTAEISEKLGEKQSRFLFWKSTCATPWIEVFWHATKNAFNKIEPLCENRTFCAVCKSEGTIIKSDNIKEAEFDPCTTHKKLTVIMGGEQGTEKKYPSDEKTDFDTGLKWATDVQGKLNNWKSKLDKYKKSIIPTTTVRSIRDDPEVKAVAEELLKLMEDKIDESIMMQLNASQLYMKAEMLRSTGSTVNSFVNLVFLIPILLKVLYL